MLQQAKDLLEEGEELHQLLSSLSHDDWYKNTPFKDWTVNKVVQHLHGTDKIAVVALNDAEKFLAGKKDRGTVKAIMNPTLEADELLDAWWNYFEEMCQLLGASEPQRRLPWFGPDMGVKMFTTARQMETWAHGQDVYDLLKLPRTNTDRLLNIAVIGVKTYGWTFANRNRETPGPAPYVCLDSPSGANWEFNEPNADNFVKGSAVDFCHVVTQGRNIADVDLEVVGKPAQEWMAIAQCFAGPPENPPPPGRRG